MNDLIDEITPLTLLLLAAVVALGAVVPVVPTGAAVSAAAVIAVDQHWWDVPPVVLVGALGAYVGDLTTYAVLSVAGASLARRLGWLPDPDPSTGERPTDHSVDHSVDHQETRLEHLRAGIERHELRTLLVSRLVPGGRVPVLLVAALTGYPVVRFASAAVGAALLWSAVYATVGIVGGSIFDDTLTAILVAMAAALLLGVVPGLARRLLADRRHGHAVPDPR